jgi:hypothetical protein
MSPHLKKGGKTMRKKSKILIVTFLLELFSNNSLALLENMVIKLKISRV